MSELLKYFSEVKVGVEISEKWKEPDILIYLLIFSFIWKIL